MLDANRRVYRLCSSITTKPAAQSQVYIDDQAKSNREQGVVAVKIWRTLAAKVRAIAAAAAAARRSLLAAPLTAALAATLVARLASTLGAPAGAAAGSVHSTPPLYLCDALFTVEPWSPLRSRDCAASVAVMRLQRRQDAKSVGVDR